MRGFLFALSLLCCAAQAGAGAWPRARGEAFISVSHAASTGTRTLLAPQLDLNQYTSLYAEYGLTSRLTLGFDAGYGFGDNSGDGSGDGSSDGFGDNSVRAGSVFARYPLYSDDAGHRFAAQLGLGLIEDAPDGRQSRVIPALAWGYGFASRWGGGWMGIEGSADIRHPSGDVVWKADLTLGLKPTERWMAILQVQNGLFPGSEPQMRVAPSVVRQLSGRANLQAGVFAGVRGDESLGAKLALWLTF
jgi:hypothetical protein